MRGPVIKSHTSLNSYDLHNSSKKPGNITLSPFRRSVQQLAQGHRAGEGAESEMQPGHPGSKALPSELLCPTHSL